LPGGDSISWGLREADRWRKNSPPRGEPNSPSETFERRIDPNKPGEREKTPARGVIATVHGPPPATEWFSESVSEQAQSEKGSIRSTRLTNSRGEAYFADMKGDIVDIEFARKVGEAIELTT
jgi:hypothetical protein